MTKSHHIIAYVQPSRLSLWQCLAQDYAARDKLFLLYGSDDRRCFGEYARPGSTLWIFSPQRQPYPPSLVAKLVIGGRDDEGTCRPRPPRTLAASFTNDAGEPFEFLACGDADASRFYGLNQMGNLLPSLGYQDQLKFRGSEWKPEYGRKFLRPRLLVRGAEQLKK